MKKLCLVHDWEYKTADGYGNVIWYGDDRTCKAQCRKCLKWKTFEDGHRFETLPDGDLKRCTRCGREFSTAPKPLTLDQALEYIHSVNWRGSVPGLSRTRELLGKMSLDVFIYLILS